MSEAELKQRTVRSFVKRTGRMTPSQTAAMDRLLPEYGLSAQTPVDPVDAFGRSAPLIVEIGFGMGQALAEMAAAQPDKNFLGIEVHTPGVGALLKEIHDRGVSNIRIVQADAVPFLASCFARNAVDRVNIYFPDPWPKKRHHKRRLIQVSFLSILYSVMKPGGILHIATDWEPYAQEVLELLDNLPQWENTAGSGRFHPRPAERPMTKFEKRGIRLGHGVWDLIFRRI